MNEKLYAKKIAYIIEAVIFDLDGVLVFTDKYHCMSWQMLADKMGWHFSETLNHKLRGIPRMDSLQIVLDHNNVQSTPMEKEEYAQLKNQFFHEIINEQLDRNDMYPGSLDFLEALRDRSIKMALCSSSRNARLVIQKLQIENYFQAVVSGNDIEKGKPDPQIFLKGARHLNIMPEKCVVFEDAESGIQAANAAGMKAIGVGDETSVPNAESRIRSYDQIDIDFFLKTGCISTDQGL